MTSNQNTLLGALKSATTTIVTRPASPAPGHPQHQPPLEQLKDLETIFDEDIKFETDSNPELLGTNNTLPLYEPPDREDWQQDLQRPKHKKKNRCRSRSFSTDYAFFNS